MTAYQGKTVLVTGAGSGIGAACATAFAAQGARVVCTDRDGDAAAATAHRVRTAGGVAQSLTLDVSAEEGWEALTTSPAPDVIIHAAGIAAGARIPDTTLAEWRHVMAVNLDGTFLAIRHGMRVMQSRGGVVIAIASAAGVRATPGAAAYGTSKSAVQALVRTAAKECKANGIPVRVNSISPAGVRTPLWSTMPFFRDLVDRLGSEDAAYAHLESKPGGGRFATPDEIADAAVYLASARADFITGADVVMDDGFTL